ncbi:hypothetical protein B9479_006030 [Cryptococcus floricola]|uniref:Uncharacterized protein n=1 Tax=Cryptococcus floricola TaxID=2591691 RepID=A0A5D3ATG9_9TREE|nr:hypothetical protein B9479_006030 [Cryptococcus floricola]
MVWDLEDRTTTIRVTRPDRLFWVPPPTFLVLGPYEVPHPPRRYYDAAVLSHMVIRTNDDDDLGQLMYLIRYLTDWRQPDSCGNLGYRGYQDIQLTTTKAGLV